VLGLLAGLGAGAIDASINTWAATSQSTRTLSLLHACYGLGTTAGPAIMTGVLMAGHAWQRGYEILGAMQIGLALAFAASLRLWRTQDPAEVADNPAERAPLAATLRLRATWLGIACFFLYVGLEAIAGAWIFSLLTARGADTAAAGSAVSAWWGGLFGGRVGLALLPPAPLHTRLRRCTGGIVLGAGWLALDPGHTQDLLAVALLGLAAGPIFPGLISATPMRVRSAHGANAVGLQVAAAALGQSLLPAGVGIGAVALGLELVPGALLACAALLLVAHEGLERSAPAPGLSAAARAS
jgi:fucose permease